MKNKFFDDNRNKKIYDLYKNTDKSAGEIGKEFNLSESSIRRIIANIKAGTNKPQKIKQYAGENKKKMTKKETNEQQFYDSYMKGLNTTSVQENKQVPDQQSNKQPEEHHFNRHEQRKIHE